MRALLVLAILALAGCSDPPAAQSRAQDPTDFSGLDLDATPGTGLIRGVVVDSAIRPLGGATVVVTSTGASFSTDADGRFGFSRIEPGLQVLEVSKLGFGKVQQTTEVTAGLDDPPVIKVLLQRIPGTEPFVTPLEWAGTIECSWNVGGVFATGCLLGDHIADDSRRLDPVDRVPTFLQTELLWKPTQLLGENLCMRHYASVDIGGTIVMADTCGPSPRMQRADAERLNETGVGSGKGIERVVWVSGWAGDPSMGLAMDQTFTAYTHLFYNFAPEEDWLFSVNGAPSAP